MHPLLFRIPLPAWRIPLGPVLACLAVLAGIAAFLSWRRRSSWDAAFGPLVLVAAAGLAALFLRQHVVVLAPLEVRAFGALLALSLGAGALLTQRLAERGGLDRGGSATACIEAALFGILGARLAFVALHPAGLESLTRLFAFHDGGLLAHGALAGGAVAGYLAARRKHLPPLAWLDAASPGLALGITLTRLGCYLEGCDFGRVLGPSAPGLVARLGTFPAESRAWVEQVVEQAIPATARTSLPVHPAELYEAGGGALLLLLVLAVRRRQTHEGVTALMVLAGYAVLRALVDLSREPSSEVWLGRAVALGAVSFGVLFLRRLPVAGVRGVRSGS